MELAIDAIKWVYGCEDFEAKEIYKVIGANYLNNIVNSYLASSNK